jgi:hypothetical protein
MHIRRRRFLYPYMERFLDKYMWRFLGPCTCKEKERFLDTYTNNESSLNFLFLKFRALHFEISKWFICLFVILGISFRIYTPVCCRKAHVVGPTLLSIMFSTCMDKVALYSCLNNLPSPLLHELRTTCKLFDFISKQIFRSRQYECQSNSSHSLMYQPCCKHYNKLTSGDITRFVRVDLYVKLSLTRFTFSSVISNITQNYSIHSLSWLHASNTVMERSEQL